MGTVRGIRGCVLVLPLLAAACGGTSGDGASERRVSAPAGPRVPSYDASTASVRAAPPRSHAEEQRLMDETSREAVASMEKAGRPASLVADERASHDAIGRIPPASRLAVMTLVSCQEARARESAEATLSKRVARIDAALALGQGLESAATTCRA